MPQKGLMLALSSPSGAGKTTISRLLLEQSPTIQVSRSATTRDQRPGEIDGKDYDFLSEDAFKSMVEHKELLEYAYVFQHYYGTPRAPVEDALADGNDVLFDIDWQGTQQLKLNARSQLVSVFILPPSMAELERRLIQRGRDKPSAIQYRMDRALHEISHWGEYDYVITNRDVEHSARDILAILTAEKLRRNRQPELTDTVRELVLEAERKNDSSPVAQASSS